MKAITYSRFGGPEVLQVEHVNQPVPTDNEVLVRVRAAEATKSDCEMRSFNFSVKWFWLPLRLAVGVRRPRRRILGGYFSGEVVATGRDVNRFSSGDEIFGATGLNMGAYAQFLALPQDRTMTAKPTNMSFVEAAAVPLGGLNALHFMRRAQIQPGQRVLIIGAGGSIGGHAVQIAKSMGAEVTAVDSGIKRELLHQLGADHFVDYTKNDFSATGKPYDVIFDMVPTTSYAACLKALGPQGRYLSGNPRLSIMLRSIITNLFSQRTASFAFAKERQEELEELKRLIEAGAVRPFVDRVFPMEEASEAHRIVETEQRIGTIVIAMDRVERMGSSD